MPKDVTFASAGLLCILIIGIVWPLLALGRPSNTLQATFLFTWATAILGTTFVVWKFAQATLNTLSTITLSDQVQAKLDDYEAHIEAWEDQRRSE